MTHVLTIEDDNMIAALERDFLEAQGFEVSVATTGKEGLDMLDGGNIDAVLVDIGLPDMDGFTVCKRIRSTSNIPILFITSHTDDDDKLKGLGLGADDYIVKPFNPSEMVARLKAHLYIHQRLSGQSVKDTEDMQPNIESGDLRIFIKRHQVFRGKKEIALTGKEFNLLVYLASHPNQVFSKRHLFETIWHLDACGEMATVTVHVNRLRDKLNEVEPPFSAIETVWGNGYRFRSSDGREGAN